MISRRPDLSLGHTGGGALGDTFYLSAEQIRLALAFNAEPLVMRVHLQGLPVCGTDWMSWFWVVILLRAVLTMTGTVFSCLLSTRLPAAWLWRVLQRTMCLCLSRTTALHRCDRPKSFCWRTLWHWEVRKYCKPLNISVSTFLCNCICCLATKAYWTFYEEVLSVSVVQRHHFL